MPTSTRRLPQASSCIVRGDVGIAPYRMTVDVLGTLRFFAGVFQFAAQLLSLRLAPLLAKADPQLAEGIEIAEHFQWNSGQKPKRISDKPEQFVFSRMRIVVIQR